ncbi:MAG: diguanylate cyclase, partial [Actinophytocola sp.]|nr:diguanylate cyclase [Actinophytocola sp.]
MNLLFAITVLICAGLVSHVAGLRRRINAAERAAMTDPLTGVANRAGLERDFTELVVAARQTEHVVAVLIDLNGFKGVNDAHGHGTGDQLLVHVARRLLRVRIDGRPVNVARLGGDEFV